MKTLRTLNNETCWCITKDNPGELLTAQKFIFLKYCTK